MQTVAMPVVLADRMSAATSSVLHDDTANPCWDVSDAINELTPGYESTRELVESMILDADISGASIIMEPDGTLTINGVAGYTSIPENAGDAGVLVVFEAEYTYMQEQLLQLQILTTLYSADGCWSQPPQAAGDTTMYSFSGSYTDGGEDGGGDNGATCYYIDWYDGDGNYLYSEDLGCYENQE